MASINNECPACGSEIRPCRCKVPSWNRTSLVYLGLCGGTAFVLLVVFCMLMHDWKM